jgi:hypothetical protein
MTSSRRSPAKQQLAGLTLEKSWQAKWEKALTDHGWIWSHVKVAKIVRKDGSVRNVTPTAKGWPDIQATKDGFLLIAELKKVRQYPKPEQRVWLEAFHLVSSVLVWVSRPSDPWDEVEGWLRYPETAPLVFGWEPATDKAARLANKRKGSLWCKMVTWTRLPSS